MSRWICLSIVIISLISNSNKFFEYYSEEKIKVKQYCQRLGDQEVFCSGNSRQFLHCGCEEHFQQLVNSHLEMDGSEAHTPEAQ